jgi:nucleoside-diphosphate-sugar epimerase
MTVLVTGAAGNVAGVLLPYLADLPLRLTDRAAPPELPRAETVRGELTAPGFAVSVLDGVSAVVHLAAVPHPDTSWDGLVGPNLAGIGALLAAAAEHDTPRLVLASSVHAMGGHLFAGRVPIQETWAPAPCCPYGATKAFAEAAGRAHAHRTGASVVSLRLGAVQPEPFTAGLRPTWLAPDDLGQLVRRALTTDVGSGVYHGVSAGSTIWSIERATAALGYRPALDAARYPVDDDESTSLCPPEFRFR